MQQQTITIQDVGLVEKIAAFLKVYLWEVVAIVASPLLATRFTNICKAVKRIFIKKPWPPVVWHTITWGMTFFLSFYALSFKYPDSLHEIGFISMILASFNSGIVEYMHRKAAKNDAINAMFNKVLYMDEDEIDTMTKIGAFASGMTVKVDQRKVARDERADEVTRIINADEKREMGLDTEDTTDRRK